MIMYPNYSKMAKEEYGLMESLYKLHHKPMLSIGTLEEIMAIQKEIRTITNGENKPSYKLVVLVDNAPGEVFYSIKTLFRNCLSTFNLYLTSSFENLDNRLLYLDKRIGEAYRAQVQPCVYDLDDPTKDPENEQIPVWEFEVPARDEIMPLYGDEANGFVIDDRLLRRYYIYSKVDGTERMVINNSPVFHHTPEGTIKKNEE